MEAWDVIVLGDGPAAMNAAAEAARDGASTLMISSTALGQPGMAPLEGLSASLQETNNRSHREDTIRTGAFLNDQDVVAQTTANANRHVDLLERRVPRRWETRGRSVVEEEGVHRAREVLDDDARGQGVVLNFL